MDGSLVPLGSSIHDVLAVVLANLWIKPKSPLVSWLRRSAARVWRPVDQFNAAGRARRNVAHHYDLNGELYSLFLDRDRFRRKLAVDVVSLLVAGMFHVSDEDAIRLQVVPSQQRDFFLPAR
jgi:hypothetical protein